MIKTIIYKGRKYPKFQSEGFAAQFIFPFAKQVCSGQGLDIGYCKPEWKYPGAVGVDEGKVCTPAGDEMITEDCSAINIPFSEFEFIFSSHCLEHVPDWVAALAYWQTKLKKGGVLFLYLPHWRQEYWRPWNNRKHLHSFSPKLIKKALQGMGGWTNIFVSHSDLNYSFTVIAEKV